jgi:hypothetical protein
MASPFLKVVLGSGRFAMLELWWEKLEGAAVAGLRCFVDLSLLSFLFLLGMFLLLPQHFSCFELLYRCGCYINIAGRKPVSRSLLSFLRNKMNG